MNQYFGAAGLIPNDTGLGPGGTNWYYGAAGIIPDDAAGPGPEPTPPEIFAAIFANSKIAIHSGIGMM